MDTSRSALPGSPFGLPRPAGARLARHDLRTRIEDAGEPLFLVVAPSGFGKTNLLADWARTTGAEVAWLGCRPTDAEPTQFWPRLVATLAARWPGIGSDAAMIVRRPSWDDADLVAALGRDLAEAPADAAVIVIDDCQLAEPSQPALAALAQNLPGKVRLVLASQRNPVFSTSRFRAVHGEGCRRRSCAAAATPWAKSTRRPSPCHWWTWRARHFGDDVGACRRSSTPASFH